MEGCIPSQKNKYTGKRKNYASWDATFMKIAFVIADRSKDPSTQVGACIVSTNNIVLGIGYNGMPIGCDDDEFPWHKQKEDPYNCKYSYVVHAEVNAILNSNSSDLEGSILYTTLFPCNECAKFIVQKKIKKIIYNSKKDKLYEKCSERMFDKAGIVCVDYSKLI